MMQQRYSRGLHEPIDDRCSESGWSHGGSKSNKDVDLFIQLRVYAESRKSLSGALAKSNVTDAGGFRGVENILDGIRNIMPSEIIDAKVPERRRVGAVMN